MRVYSEPRSPVISTSASLLVLLTASSLLLAGRLTATEEPESSSIAPPQLQVEQRSSPPINPNLVIHFDEYPLGTPITNQYAGLGIVFGGDAPFPSGDTSNPTSPVLSGSPRFRGAIEGRFVEPGFPERDAVVSSFSLDAGYFDEIGSVRLTWYDQEGHLLGQRAGSQFGIQTLNVSGGGIHRFRIEIINTEPAGFAIDNFSFVRSGSASLLFRENLPYTKEGSWGSISFSIPGWDHVALALNDVVYESHPGYEPGTYRSANGTVTAPIMRDNGVQAQHKVATFLHDSRSASTPVVETEQLFIDATLGQKMATQIQSKLAAPYPNVLWEFLVNVLGLGPSPLSPLQQKGGSGAFTCSGLVEWAAEKANHHGGRGFVPNSLESFTVLGPNLIPPLVTLYEVPLLSPQLLHYMVKFDDLIGSAPHWLQGFFDPVDFLVIDPRGRRLGYSHATGELREIPGAFYSGDGAFEQFAIPDPLPGIYRFEFHGLGATANGAVQAGGRVGSISRPIAGNETLIAQFTVDQAPGGRGDLDRDGDVDNLDRGALLGRLNSFPLEFSDPADVDANGIINQADVNILGQICSRPGCQNGAGAPCLASPTSTCLQRGRFQVSLSWKDFLGNTGDAEVLPVGSQDSGLFWFFQPNNWEALVKVLDGCAINNRFWVFAAATTNVEYTLRVSDSVTGQTREYHNPLGVKSPAITDVQAFSTCSASFSPVEHPSMRSAVEFLPSLTEPVVVEKAGSCVAGDTVLCLQNGRFEVKVDWQDFGGHAGSGHAVQPRSTDSGMFWFFDPNNWEQLVKVLDGCGVNGKYWVFAAATTNVAYTLRIEDHLTGAVKVYRNPLGNAAATIGDVEAFGGCS